MFAMNVRAYMHVRENKGVHNNQGGQPSLSIQLLKITADTCNIPRILKRHSATLVQGPARRAVGSWCCCCRGHVCGKIFNARTRPFIAWCLVDAEAIKSRALEDWHFAGAVELHIPTRCQCIEGVNDREVRNRRNFDHATSCMARSEQR